MMDSNNFSFESAVILQFPSKARIAANRIAEQMRLAAASRTVDVSSASSWYHEEAMAEENRRA